MSTLIRQRSAPLQRFTGGLNNYWDQSSIDDTELASVINLEFSTSGSLIQRPPIYTEKNLSGVVVKTPAVNEPLDIIGTYVEASGTRYLVCITDDKTWIYNVTTKAWTMIATFRASDCTQYDNKIVLCSTTQSGGYWEAGTYHATNMPHLGGIELFQNRFFGFGVEGTSTANTIYWSNITTFGPSGQITSVWDWLDATMSNMYVEIGTGDGQWITAIAQGYNDIVIFRNRSTYRYSYGELPEEGTMQAMQQDIGAENRRSVVKFENAHFVLSGGILYKYQNWLYYPLNVQKVKFIENATSTNRFEHAVSLVGRRAIVWHNGSLYAYNLDTETWSEWVTEYRAGYFVTVPRNNEDNIEELYYGVSGIAEFAGTGVTDYSMFRTENMFIGANGAEAFECSIRTKIYDFNTPVEWKRLFFWSADIATGMPVRAVAYPVALPEIAPTLTWDEISKDFAEDNAFYTWDSLNSGTWDVLKNPSGGVSTIVDSFSATQLLRMEAKLNQNLRFRRIYFELYLNSDGTAATTPVQIYSIVPMIGAKAKIAKEAN